VLSVLSLQTLHLGETTGPFNNTQKEITKPLIEALMLICYHRVMSDHEKIERDWFIGTLEIDDYSIPIIGRGATKQEAEKEALRRMARVWVESLDLEERLGLNVLEWWSTSVSD
jgi:hypothetical protein